MPRVTPAFRIHTDLQYVGKLVRMAKRRVTWKFAFEGDDDEHSIVLQHTLNSGKKVVFLNGNQIFEDEKLSAGDFVYPFQLDGHLITVVINAQVGDEGMYDLRVDGRCWDDLRLTTLEDLRARAKGGRPVTDSAWARGGAVAGVSADSAIYTGAAVADEAPEPVATLSMKDFVGSGGSSKAASAGGADAFGMAAAEASGAWDPFSGGGDATASAARGGGGFADFGAPAPAPAADPWGAPAPAPAPVIKKPTTSTTSATALKPPTGAAAAHRPAAAAAAPAYDPFGDAPAAPAPAAAGLADDFASLSFGSAPAPAAASAAARRPSGQQAAAADPFGMGGLSMGAAPARAAPAADPFGMGGLSMGTGGGAAAAPGGGGGLEDIFATQPAVRSAGGSTSRPGSAGGAHAPSLSGGLVDLDNLTASKPVHAGPSGPTLGQLRGAGPAQHKNVMGGALATNTASAAVALGGLDFGLGMPTGPVAGGAPRPMGGYGAQPMGGMGMGMGGGMQGGMGGMGMGMGGFGAPAQAPAKQAEYNPFE